MKEMKRIPIVIAILLLLLGGLGYYVNQILIQDLKSTQQQIAEAENKLAVRETELESVQQLNQEFATIKKKADLALTALPNEKQKPALLYQLLSLADKNGIDVGSLSSSDPSDNKTPGLKEIQISMSVRCSYKQALDLLEDMSSSMRLVSITAISISASDTEDDQNLTLTISATTFFLPVVNSTGNPGAGSGGAPS